MNSPLNLYSAFEITKYFQRHSLVFSFQLSGEVFFRLHSQSQLLADLRPHPTPCPSLFPEAKTSLWVPCPFCRLSAYDQGHTLAGAESAGASWVQP